VGGGRPAWAAPRRLGHVRRPPGPTGGSGGTSFEINPVVCPVRRPASAHGTLRRCTEVVWQGDTPEKRMMAPPPQVVVVALRNRLGAAIAKDWLAAAGLAADRHNTDARTRAARPTNIDEFQERWGSVSDVSDGRCTPHPRKLETEMEPD
jgi:hypothetical protein